MAGNKNSGRMSDALKHRFREIIESPSGLQKFKRIMAATKKEDTFLQYFKESMDRGHGKVPQQQDINDITEKRADKDGLEEALRSIRDIAKRAGLDKGE